MRRRFILILTFEAVKIMLYEVPLFHWWKSYLRRKKLNIINKKPERNTIFRDEL